MLNKLLGYIKNLNDPTCKGASLRHVAYMVAVGASVVWLSVDMALKEGGVHRGIDGNWVTAFGLFLAAVTGGKVFGGRNSSSPIGVQSAAPTGQGSSTGTQDQAGDTP